ncbi:MAG: helix-hairpin-helix domain-containing protein [Erysipelotrichales bacterium]|nr:helix-hairpin-helix domain-containing protein [Erysipelotrichales bacterium]
MAGGLKSNATTDNLNLSQKVTSEMVIYVYTKTELKNSTNTTTSPSTSGSTTSPSTSGSQGSSNICDPNLGGSSSTEVSSLVNINTASKEELMTIPNIGASKADAIIIYRSEHVFTKIEDIINVSGIGDTLFAKIKDYITV